MVIAGTGQQNLAMPAAKKPARTAPLTVRQWREHRGLTLEQVANIIGVGAQAVHKWETGKTPLEIEKLKLLAKIYDTTPDALLYPPDEGELVEQMRRAHDILKKLPRDSAERWLGVGEEMKPPKADQE